MMILAWSVLLLVLAGIVFLLFTPLVIHIDTTADLFQLRWGCLRFRILFSEHDLGYRVTAPFVHKEGSFLQRTVPAAPREPGSVKAGRSPWSARKASALVRSFHVRRFRWVCDTGDVLLNAWLFPVFCLLRDRGHNVRISFTGEEELLIVLDNNLYRLLRAVLFTNQNHTKP